jgi:hypothetical protein
MTANVAGLAILDFSAVTFIMRNAIDGDRWIDNLDLGTYVMLLQSNVLDSSWQIGPLALSPWSFLTLWVLIMMNNDEPASRPDGRTDHPAATRQFHRCKCGRFDDSARKEEAADDGRPPHHHDCGWFVVYTTDAIPAPMKKKKKRTRNLQTRKSKCRRQSYINDGQADWWYPFYMRCCFSVRIASHHQSVP